MGSELIVQEPGLPGLNDGHAADETARWFCQRIDFTEGPRDQVHGDDARLPTPAERDAMTARLADVNAALRPVGASMADKDRLHDALVDFFIGYPSLRNADAQVMVAAYIMDLQPLPLFAIKAALTDIKHGRVYDTDPRTQRRVPLSPDFPPSTPRIIAVAQKRAEAVHVNRLTLENALAVRRLAPPPLSEERQQEIAGGLRDLAASMSVKRIEREEAEEADRRRRREADQRRDADAHERKLTEEWRLRGVTDPPKAAGVVISPALAAKVEGWKKDDARREEEEARREQDREDEAADGARYGTRGKKRRPSR